MTTPDFDTLVIGSGFAGLSVAHALGGSGVAVIDRGEPLRLAEQSAAFEARRGQIVHGPTAPEHLPAQLELEAQLMTSRLPGNAVQLPLSRMSANLISHVQGGISNWWGGYAARISPDTFARDGVLRWPLSAQDMDPHYRQAEQLLRVHGDPTSADHSVFGDLPGWDYWRGYFQDLFPRARVTPQAKNISDTEAAPLGLCQGNGHCAMCPNDAKARPATVFPGIDVLGGTRVDRIVFDGARAVAIQGQARGESFEVSFRRLVVAAGGLENVALLRRSGVPAEVRERIGQHYQDHTTCELLGILPTAFQPQHLGAEGGVEIPELSGYIEGIEVKTIMLPVALSADAIRGLVRSSNSWPGLKLATTAHQLQRTASFYLQMEVPPEWNLHLRTRGSDSYLHTMPYLRHLPELDAVVLEVARRMQAAGVQVAAALPHHRERFGGHHYSGTTPMSANERQVVDSNLRLVGTDNLYVNGGSVLPRCGGSGPTLSIVALGLRLGTHLAAQRH